MSSDVAFVGAADVAAIIGHGEAQVWRLTRAGRLPSPIRIGRRTLWRKDEVTAWVERETTDYRAGRRLSKPAHLPTKPGRRPRHTATTEGIPTTEAAALTTVTSSAEVTP